MGRRRVVLVMSVTILDVAIGKGATPNDKGGYTGSEFERLGLPMLGGCEVCGATIAAYNAYPSTSGYLRCADDIDDLGFASVEDFDAWIEEVE